MQQNVKKTRIAAWLATVLTFGLLASFAQAATFSGEAVFLVGLVRGGESLNALRPDDAATFTSLAAG